APRSTAISPWRLSFSRVASAKNASEPTATSVVAAVHWQKDFVVRVRSFEPESVMDILSKRVATFSIGYKASIFAGPRKRRGPQAMLEGLREKVAIRFG